MAKRKRAWWKRAFNFGKEQRNFELKALMDELNLLMNRSHAFKIEGIIAGAKKIIEQHLEHDPRAIIPIAEKVLKNVAEHIDIELAAHPTDAAILTNSLHEIPNAARRNFSINVDETIKRGSLVVKANKSIIDAHLSTQLDRAKAILLT